MHKNLAIAAQTLFDEPFAGREDGDDILVLRKWTSAFHLSGRGSHGPWAWTHIFVGDVECEISELGGESSVYER